MNDIIDEMHKQIDDLFLEVKDFISDLDFKYEYDEDLSFICPAINKINQHFNLFTFKGEVKHYDVITLHILECYQLIKKIILIAKQDQQLKLDQGKTRLFMGKPIDNLPSNRSFYTFYKIDSGLKQQLFSKYVSVTFDYVMSNNYDSKAGRLIRANHGREVHEKNQKLATLWLLPYIVEQYLTNDSHYSITKSYKYAEIHGHICELKINIKALQVININDMKATDTIVENFRINPNILVLKPMPEDKEFIYKIYKKFFDVIKKSGKELGYSYNKFSPCGTFGDYKNGKYFHKDKKGVRGRKGTPINPYKDKIFKKIKLMLTGCIL